jgi:hypothetical protein
MQSAIQAPANSKQQRYQQMWRQYSQGVPPHRPVRLDYLVGRRAFEDGCSQQEIALMLVAGSPQVARLYRQRGKDKAREYANGVARGVCQAGKGQIINRSRRRQIEL